LLLGIAALALLAPLPVFSMSLEELAGPERAAALRSAEGVITEVQLKNPGPRLLPRHEELRRLIAETMDNLGPSLFVETLAVYKKPQDRAWNEAEQTALFNRLAALSTLTGIQYYSASRKTMRTLYESSTVIDDPAGRKAAADPVFTRLPAALTLYARQKDLTFGDNIYRYDYRTAADAIFFVQENLTAMNAGVIPAVGKNKLRALMAVLDAGDFLLIYAASMAKAASLPGMGGRIGESFSNRAQAVIKWFSGRADGVFGNRETPNSSTENAG
jgi:hypothetical protein